MKSQPCIQDLLVVVVETNFLGESETDSLPAFKSDIGGLTENFLNVDTGRGEVVDDGLELRVKLEDGLCTRTQSEEVRSR